MRFYVVCIGKLKDAYLRDGVAEFVKRMRPYGGITITELNESKIGDKPSDADRKQVVDEEGERLLKVVPKNAYTVLLDVYGKTMSSEDLAKTVAKLEVDGVSDMAFIIGGAFGVSEALRQSVNYKLSFSPMTFTHQMVRLLLVEQIYRASKINRNEPYHW
ncbi:MAG: 23S rRNA (pseudouridine(1915)-N(3))-methyltransferase RlmH [Veillonella sp.]|jgi:ribosomal RNA large subunit methyltransferase H|uniref:23S rRNA (pseudouridine(1915)-N(3))-methyltransferase RlmH n=1 Tax=Veillonella sp. TaxID=1926307 RepID=UPI001CAF31B3|nr:23S rRNA (pseudouridine(1915)-N(3))-methyltransferase RlmH [Veillonella sp.]MBF1745646.1 23S rRNA (pseudouridine(1915)-N(3))-methyltransferase RlmH [Veillonella sp.]MBF1753920.1 23S rRNA (pseudouridine(1915)-N(3))-methyltransferase RlmH [Veillonella sp.]MBF1764045.1 23S rRNA (pseudouridine(1915)-N(3))-methyltransferase RlmH [Veillonella sp.]MBF1765947.1 23S rRNA (pseudouridine(1915)-N(3))-methyltransferase RlmH [Veillonella sp.]MDU1129364.1 23S rRNA (pseudouridine(1915)-N(3))-methyltransfer